MEFIKKLFSGDLGWKSLLGALVILVTVVLRATGTIDESISDQVFKVGEAIGIVGLRDAFTKIAK